LVVTVRSNSPAVQGAPYFDWPVARVEKELERAKCERAIDAGGGADARRRDRAEQHHLQPAVLTQLEAVIWPRSG
jgi:hypothetical protein